MESIINCMKTFFYVFSTLYFVSFLTILYIYKTDSHLNWVAKLNKIEGLETEIKKLKEEIILLKTKD